MKSWRITLTSAYFYLIPLGFSLLKRPTGYQRLIS